MKRKGSTSFYLVTFIFLSVSLLMYFLYVNISPQNNTKNNLTENDYLAKMMQNNQILLLNRWLIEEDNILALVKKRENYDNCDNYECVKLLLIDKNNKTIYEDIYDEIQSISSSYILRKGSPQLIIRGKQNNIELIKILDYRHKKVLSLTDSIVSDMDNILNVDIRPQFQTGIKTAATPYQILITTGIGLPSPEEKFTKVFRYDNKKNEYFYVGQFSTAKLDNYIDELISNRKK